MSASHLKNLPCTIDEAVDYLLANLSLNDEVKITLMKKEDLPALHFSLGAYIRNAFRLWSKGGHRRLMMACRQHTGNNELHEDDAAALIIQALWERLQHKGIMKQKG